MPINLRPTQQDYVSNKKKSNIIELLFFIALNVLVIPFSAYQTFIGYEKDVAGNPILAMVVAGISAVLFAAMNFGIRSDRLQGKKHLLKVFMYIIPLGLSFFGNFNAFYANQMKDNLLKNEITKYKYTLTQTRDISVRKINESIGLDFLEEQYKQKLNDLNTEYYDAIPPSWGPRAQSKWVELVAFLKKEGGEIKVSAQGKNKQYYLSNAQAFSESTYKTLVASKEKQVEEPLTYIENKYTPVINQIDSLSNLSKPVFKSNMLDKMVEAENQIRTKTESFLNTKDVFDYPPLKPSSENEIGTIKHTINSAFVKKENPAATAFSLFLSLIIDLSALLYIVVFIPYNSSSKKGGRINNGPKRI